MAKGEMIAAVLVQARAHDGRKGSSCDSVMNNIKNVEEWIEGQIRQYRAFKKRVQPYPHHRRRLAYVVKVYAKEST